MAKVTGIGGVFFKSRGDKDALADWYRRHLGMPLESWGGAVLRWPDDQGTDKGHVFGPICEKVPVYVVMEQKTALLGAAQYGMLEATVV